MYPQNKYNPNKIEHPSPTTLILTLEYANMVRVDNMYHRSTKLDKNKNKVFGIKNWLELQNSLSYIVTYDTYIV